ncbi:MAG: hypothetical protein H0X37_02285 [Herpetosiphonaceae bacterium]|nr:hypothetical protein [Herpetosiphonaceae bacterium]
MLLPEIADLYDTVLAQGEPGVDRFYAALRDRRIDPVPNPATGSRNLYNPSPMIVSGTLVEQMVADANRFCGALRAEGRNGAALLARMPSDVRDTFASPEIADRIVSDLRVAHPLTGVDAFLEATTNGLKLAYLEWQTVGMYLTLGRLVLQCMAQAWPVLAERASLTAQPTLTLAALGERLRAFYLAGIEDDPRQGVVLDYQPMTQPTRDEFRAIQQLTGGERDGMAILDPRAITRHNGRPHYRRDGLLIPVRRVYARLVYSDMQRLLAESTATERTLLRDLFGGGTDLSWISHPLHFFYGSKADFPRFWQQGLSSALGACWTVDQAFMERQAPTLVTGDRLVGYVQKPVTGQSGQGVIRHPRFDELRLGAVLQREIVPADCHLTLWGRRTPEIRVMCLPEADGTLAAGLVYTRVKAPEVFLSNAGDLAARRIPGTGEGYGVVVFP